MVLDNKITSVHTTYTPISFHIRTNTCTWTRADTSSYRWGLCKEPSSVPQLLTIVPCFSFPLHIPFLLRSSALSLISPFASYRSHAASPRSARLVSYLHTITVCDLLLYSSIPACFPPQRVLILSISLTTRQ